LSFLDLALVDEFYMLDEKVSLLLDVRKSTHNRKIKEKYSGVLINLCWKEYSYKTRLRMNGFSQGSIIS